MWILINKCDHLSYKNNWPSYPGCLLTVRAFPKCPHTQRSEFKMPALFFFSVEIKCRVSHIVVKSSIIKQQLQFLVCF